MVPPEAEPPAPAVDVEVCLSALEQPARPPAAAMPAAPRKPRLLRKPLLWSLTGSLSARPAAAVLHYRAHPLTISASHRKLGRLNEGGPESCPMSHARSTCLPVSGLNPGSTS